MDSNDYTGARSEIDSAIAEHDSYVSRNNIPIDGISFTSLDNMTLHHASRHLEHAEIE